MEATTLYLANGLSRTVKGRADDIGNALRARKMSGDDGIRQFITTGGEPLTVNIGGVLFAERAKNNRAKGTFGFARALATT